MPLHATNAEAGSGPSRPSQLEPATADRADADAALARVVRSAATGDDRAWRELYGRFTPKIRRTARGFGLNAADVDDVVQSTWLAAVRGIHQIRKPEAIGDWLLVTARREALRTLQRGVRELPMDELPDSPDGGPGFDNELVEAERRDAVRAAVGRLPHRQRRLAEALLEPSAASYTRVAETLEIPIGSIGPTRARVLERLRRDRRLCAVVSAEPASRAA
jgi:RNA polymerase sigma factor (sigma-70 family)